MWGALKKRKKLTLEDLRTLLLLSTLGIKGLKFFFLNVLPAIHGYILIFCRSILWRGKYSPRQVGRYYNIYNDIIATLLNSLGKHFFLHTYPKIILVIVLLWTWHNNWIILFNNKFNKSRVAFHLPTSYLFRCVYCKHLLLWNELKENTISDRYLRDRYRYILNIEIAELVQTNLIVIKCCLRWTFSQPKPANYLVC